MKRSIAQTLTIVALVATTVAAGSLVATAALGDISTIAGTGTAGYSGDGGPAASAEFSSPYGFAIAPNGDLYIADTQNHRIRKIDSTGTVTTVIGTGTAGFSGDGGPATSAAIRAPIAMVWDSTGNFYFTDTGNHRIRKVDTSGNISTVAGGVFTVANGVPATSSFINTPQGVTVDKAGNLYIGEYMGNRIRKVDATTGIITTIAGDGTGGFTGDGGPATSAQVFGPYGLTVDGAGNLFFSDALNRRVRRIDAVTGIITTIVGDGVQASTGDGGPSTSARINYPTGLTFDAAGDLYIAEMTGGRVRKIDTSGNISTVAGKGGCLTSGDGGPATAACTPSVIGVGLDATGNLYLLQGPGHIVRKVEQLVVATTTTTSTTTTTTIAPATTTTVAAPTTTAPRVTTTTAAGSNGNDSGTNDGDVATTGGSLPRTGTDPASLLVFAALAGLAGLVLVSRRRLHA